MEEITLQSLLEAGCHFGHKAERWHPKAAKYIYAEKDGIHIIDLLKTKEGLEKACQFLLEFIQSGGEALLVATKRQAQGIVKEEATKAAIPYLVTRWIGGFLTNWDQVQKNISKIKRLESERDTGFWKKYPKHEQVKLARYIERLKIFYGGVLALDKKPEVMIVIDVKKEDAAIREAKRVGIPVIAVVDTNSDPSQVDFPIPANDDAVGSITIITKYLVQAYMEGKNLLNKPAETKPEEKPPAKKRGKPKKE